MSDGIGLVEFLRIASSLLVVSGVIVGCGWLMRRTAARRGQRQMVVEERMSVARGSQLMIVGVGERRMLVGVCDKAISLVSELEPSAVAAEVDIVDDTPAASSPIDFARVLAERLRGVRSAER